MFALKPTKPERYRRICPTHYVPVEFVAGIPLCPEGHEVAVWFVADSKEGVIVAASSLDTVVLAFAIELPDDARRILAVPRGSLAVSA